MIIILRAERYEKIIQLVRDRAIVSVSEFCNELNASKATIRRDLNELHAKGFLKKTHGGAMVMSTPTTEELPIEVRRLMRKDEKSRIADLALEYIKEDSSIFLDSGTTTFEIAEKLSTYQNLTILTNDINIAYEVSQNTQNNVIVAGGKLKKHSATLMGMFTEQMISQIHVDTAFISVDAVEMKHGFMDYNTDEIPIKREMIQNSRQSIVVCDHSKFQNAAFMTICPINDINLTITGRELDDLYVKKFEEAGFVVKLA